MVFHYSCLTYLFVLEGGFGDDGEEKLIVDEEGGGWDVGDDDLELPADMVSVIY